KLAENLIGHENNLAIAASTWAVSTIAAQQLDDGGQLVRVIVTLARPGRYDVKATGNELVVTVTARDPAPAKGDSDAIAKAEATAKQAVAEAERLRRVAQEQADKAAAALKAVEDAKRQGQASTADLDRAKRDADRAKA